MSKTSLVISALGEDRPGLVNELSESILEYQGSIADSRMTVLGGHFAIILLVDGNWNNIAKLEDHLPAIGEKLGLTINLSRTVSKTGGKQQLPYVVEVIALDQPGIVHKLAEFFSKRSINIRDLSTSTYAAAHSGTQMFSVQIRLDIPADQSIAVLRDEFMDFCDQMNLDAIIEPYKP